MDTHEEILDFVIEKRNELANEIYDFFAVQKKEIYSSFYEQIDNLNKHLVEYIDYKTDSLINYLEKKERKKQQDQDFTYIKAFFEKNYNSDYSKIIMIGIPEHGNIGDHAITCGEKAFFRENFREYPALFLSWRMLEENECYLKSHINEKDIICIHGGGFLGTLWIEEQDHTNDIIEQFSNNPIVIFPQTFWYDNGGDANSCLEKFDYVMEKCSKICVCLREKESFNRFKDRYPYVQTFLVPDMALYLKPNIKKSNTDDILFCLRTDKEKIVSNDCEWKSLVESRGYSFRETTTIIDETISFNVSEKYVWDKLYEFANAKLIITDRLHGMIFAALVNTPCIAFNNISGKVKGVYEWIDEFSNVQFVESEKGFEQAFESWENHLKDKGTRIDRKQYSNLVHYLKSLM